MSFQPADAERQWALHATLPGLLPAYLMSQRWFAGKGRTIALVRLVDLVWLPAGDGADVMVVAEVIYADGESERYCLWLGRRDAPDGLPIVGQKPGGAGWIVDVATDPRATPGLLHPFAAAAELPTAGGGGVRFADVDPAAAAAITGAPAIRALGTDQSNTSIKIGDGLVFKLFRRQQTGLNPEVEIGRFLTTRTAFAAFAALRGSVAYVAPDGTTATVGVLQTWIDNVGDGWRYVQTQLAGDPTHAGTWATARADLLGLGATTRAFHEALASDPSSPDFAPDPVTPADVTGWVAGLSARAGRLAARLAAGTDFAEDWAPRLVPALRGLAAPGRGLTPSIEGPGGFRRIRVHGDFHLGQTLKTPSGFALVDFEGEPTRSIAERRQKHSALKDVAGMLRSFEYAVAVAGSSANGAERRRRAAELRSGFLDGYFGVEAATAAFLPADDESRRGWLRFFELDKALYELDYELASRPAWAHIPAIDILRLLDG